MGSAAGYGQELRIRAMVGQEELQWNKEYLSAAGEKWRFSQISFYLSDFSWTGEDGSTLAEPKRAELLQANAENDSMIIRIPDRPKRVCFRFGLDSAMQVSGRTDAALDPANGMYWAWNTGYIQCRLEGFSSASKGKKGKFEFHLGGYMEPFTTDAKYCLNLPAGNPEVVLDLKPFMDAVLLKKIWSVLIPGAEAKQLSQLIGKGFNSRTGK